MRTPKILSIDEICATKFISLKTAEYKDKNNNVKKWDFVSRTTGKGIVMIIPFNESMRKVLMIKQPRVPVQKIVYSFPAGIMEEGETAIDAARRELKEETGYIISRILSTSPNFPKSAGLTDESTYQIQCIVKSEAEKQELEETENISFFWITPRAMYKKVFGEKFTRKNVMESDAWNFISGYVRAKKYKV